jgi:protein SCO1
MPRINPLLFFAILFVAVFAASYTIRFPTPGAGGAATARIGGPFVLTDTKGKRVTERDFRGRFMVVFFGYTHCPDVCPTELQNMTSVLDKLGPAAKEVAPIFVSVDPARDTPEALSAYLGNFSPAIIGLTGTTDEVANAARAYRVYYKQAEGGAAGGYSVDHSVFIYLMDREGNYLTHFMFNAPAETLAAAIAKYISGEKGS